MKKRFPYLAQCKDADILFSSLTEEQLEYIDSSILEYETTPPDVYDEKHEDYPTVIQWFEGLVDTNDLIEMLQY